MLSQVQGFQVPTPRGAFYAYPDVTALFGRKLRGVTIESSLQLADMILDMAEVAVVPGEAFGPTGFLRFSYAIADEEIVTGITRVQELMAEVQ